MNGIVIIEGFRPAYKQVDYYTMCNLQAPTLAGAL